MLHTNPLLPHSIVPPPPACRKGKNKKKRPPPPVGVRDGRRGHKDAILNPVECLALAALLFYSIPQRAARGKKRPRRDAWAKPRQGLR